MPVPYLKGIHPKVIPLRPFLIVQPNSDTRVVAICSVNDTTVNAGFQAILAIKK